MRMCLERMEEWVKGGMDEGKKGQKAGRQAGKILHCTGNEHKVSSGWESARVCVCVCMLCMTTMHIREDRITMSRTDSL